jgi:hypothetical protein
MDKRNYKKLEIVAEQIINSYKYGATLHELATLHDCAPGTIRNILIARGEPRRKRGRKKKEGVNENLQQVQGGETP